MTSKSLLSALIIWLIFLLPVNLAAHQQISLQPSLHPSVQHDAAHQVLTRTYRNCPFQGVGWAGLPLGWTGVAPSGVDSRTQIAEAVKPALFANAHTSRKTCKKSQAAMEFLLTYGWAIVVVVTAIAALAYFGVLDTDKYAPSMCTLPAGLSCLDHGVMVYNEGFGDMNRLVLNIKNNMGFGIELIEIRSEFDAFKDLTYYDLLPNGQKTGTAGIPNIQLNDITKSLTTSIVFLEGQKYEIEFTLTYIHHESGLPHTEKGTITGKVIKE